MKKGDGRAVQKDTKRKHKRQRNLRRSAFVFEQERDFHVDAVFGHFTILAHDLLFVDPGTLDALDGTRSAGDAFVDGILKTLGGRGRKLDHFDYGHKKLLEIGSCDERAMTT